MSFYKWCISTFFLFFLILGIYTNSWSKIRPIVGISPSYVIYPSNLSWVGYFLQEELTHQLNLVRSISLKPSQTMQLWNAKLDFSNEDEVDSSLLNLMKIQLFLKIKLQKVVGHASITGTLYHLGENQDLQSTDFQDFVSWKSPDIFVQFIINKLKTLSPLFSKVTFYPQHYKWESLEAFYKWKLQPTKLFGTPEWSQYKSELESLLSHYPDVARLIYPELASLLLLEGTQPKINALLLKQAEDAIKEALHLDPNNDQYHSLLAFIYFFQNDKILAKSETVIANAHNPQNTLARVLYGLTIGQSFREGEKYILLGFENNPFLKEYPLFANRNLPIYEALLPLLSNWTSSQPIPTNKKYDNKFAEGVALFRKKQLDEAEIKFEFATALDSSQIAPLLYLARISMAKKKFKETISFLNSLKEQFPENAQLFYYLGVSYEYLKSYHQAENQFRQAIFLKTNYPQALLRLGIILTKLKRLDEAQNFLETLTTKYPKFSSGWFNLGVLFSIKRDWENANRVLSEALRLSPKNIRIQKLIDKIKVKNN